MDSASTVGDDGDSLSKTAGKAWRKGKLLTYYFLPIAIAVILSFGYLKGKDVFSAFIKEAWEELKTAISVNIAVFLASA